MLRRSSVAGSFLVLLFASATSARAEVLAGKVVGVYDGDTITVLDESEHTEHIRLAGVDAPEKKQAFGNRSKQSLSDLVFGKRVRVEWTKRDRYSRILGKVLAADPECLEISCPKIIDAGFQQITDGLAWHYKKYEWKQSPADRKRYAAAEEKAREAKQGLWKAPSPVPPWEFRRPGGRTR